MILHDRGSSAPLHSKRRFANLPGLILKRLIWSYQWIWNPGLFVLRPSPHARHGLVSYLHAPQKGNVMCTDCTTQTFTVRWDLFSTLHVLLPQWSVQLIHQTFLTCLPSHWGLTGWPLTWVRFHVVMVVIYLTYSIAKLSSLEVSLTPLSPPYLSYPVVVHLPITPAPPAGAKLSPSARSSRTRLDQASCIRKTNLLTL